jgi:hypothetical protein
MSALLLSRTLDPADYLQFAEELQVVDRGLPQPRLPFQDDLDDHPHRRWEYALALHSVWRWATARGRHPAGECCDVSTDSPFAQMLSSWCQQPVLVLDPHSLEASSGSGAQLADVVTCLSVLEHVEALDPFLSALSGLVAPGGLLVLTFDYWNRCGPDTAQFHHRRQRIFCPQSALKLRHSCAPLQLTPFGGVDLTWHGAQVHDYTFASLVLEKQR